jgi:hypothetical protein
MNSAPWYKKLEYQLLNTLKTDASHGAFPFKVLETGCLIWCF